MPTLSQRFAVNLTSFHSDIPFITPHKSQVPWEKAPEPCSVSLGAQSATNTARERQVPHQWEPWLERTDCKLSESCGGNSTSTRGLAWLLNSLKSQGVALSLEKIFGSVLSSSVSSLPSTDWGIRHKPQHQCLVRNSQAKHAATTWWSHQSENWAL